MLVLLRDPYVELTEQSVINVDLLVALQGVVFNISCTCPIILRGLQSSLCCH